MSILPVGLLSQNQKSLAGRTALALFVLAWISFCIFCSGILWLRPEEADSLSVAIIVIATVLVIQAIWSHQHSAPPLVVLHHLHHASVVSYSVLIALLLLATTSLTAHPVHPVLIVGLYLLTVTLMSVAILSRAGSPIASGAMLRFLLDSIMVGIMVWIGLLQTVPQMLGIAATRESVAFIALWSIETGVLFAFAAASARLPHRSPILMVTSASMLVRWFAIGLWLGLVWHPQTMAWQELVVPLVVLHWALVVAALGMPTALVDAPPSDMNRRDMNRLNWCDWILFSALPMSFVMVMIAIALFGGMLSEQREILLFFALLAPLWIGRTMWESQLWTEYDRRHRIALTYALQREYDAVRRANHARQETETMVRGVMHDITYPLLALVQIHRSLRLSDHEQHCLQRQVLLIEQLNEQLRTFLLLRQQVTAHVETDVRQLCLDAVMRLRMYHPVQVRLPDSAHTCTDPVALRRVLDNLLINAGDFRADDDPVQVILDVTDSIVEITVTNEYCGTQSRIGVGSGLGRVIVAELMDQLGGHVIYHALPTGGRSVTLTLPLRLEHECHPEHRNTTGAEP
ncbi:HAMP domain-containing histidine kinase [bacterium]|nr:HAMP domain-containing histidine kinase [bacterium]